MAISRHFGHKMKIIIGLFLSIFYWFQSSKRSCTTSQIFLSHKISLCKRKQLKLINLFLNLLSHFFTKNLLACSMFDFGNNYSFLVGSFQINQLFWFPKVSLNDSSSNLGSTLFSFTLIYVIIH